MDYNVQQDTLGARIVWERCDPLVVQLSVTLEATLREAHLPRLREGGALARLVAHQSELYGADSDMRRLGREHRGLPDDLLNFHYDLLACAVAVCWDGVHVEGSGSRRDLITGCSPSASRRAASRPAWLRASTARVWSRSRWRRREE